MDPATMMLLVKGGMAVYQGVKGMSQQKEAQRAAQRAAAKMRSIQEEDKISGLQVPTLGAELARQEVAQQVSTAVEGLRTAGAAGVLGGIPSLIDVSTDKALDIAASLQEAEYQRDKFVIQQQQALEGRRIAREMGMAQMELQGAQAAVAEGKMAQQEALKLGAEAVTGFAQMKLEEAPLYETQQSSDMKQYVSDESAKSNAFTGKQLTKTETPPLSVSDEQFKGVKITGPGERLSTKSPTGEAAMVGGFPGAETAKVLSEQEALDVQRRSLGKMAYPKPPQMPAGYLPNAQLQASLEQDLGRMNIMRAPNSFPIMPPGLR